ncbi:hypothetical protein [Bombiscardovia apis]|nr:hypothetical protein [Bombiscardovia apis]
MGEAHEREGSYSHETALDEEAVEGSTSSRSTLAIAFMQLIVLALLIVPTAFAFTPSLPEEYTSWMNLLCLGIVVISLSVYSLARGGAESLFDSLFPFVLGAASLIGACYWNMVSVVSGRMGLGDQWVIVRRWINLVAVLLAILVVFTFGHQMLRLHRTQVIRGLARSIFSGLVCISVSGWIFMPALVAHYTSGFDQGVWSSQGRWFLAMAALGLVLIAGLCVSSWGWWAERGRKSGRVAQSCLVISLIPIMLSGVVIVLALMGSRVLLNLF